MTRTNIDRDETLVQISNPPPLLDITSTRQVQIPRLHAAEELRLVAAVSGFPKDSGSALSQFRRCWWLSPRAAAQRVPAEGAQLGFCGHWQSSHLEADGYFLEPRIDSTAGTVAGTEQLRARFSLGVAAGCLFDLGQIWGLVICKQPHVFMKQVSPNEDCEKVDVVMLNPQRLVNSPCCYDGDFKQIWLRQKCNHG